MMKTEMKGAYLRAIRVRPGVGHRKEMLLGVAQTKVLVVEGHAVN